MTVGKDYEEHRAGPLLLRVSNDGFGWEVFLGKRISWSSTGATTRMWPRIVSGADEVCNRAVTVVLWPVGHLSVWWEPRWRTEQCDDCRRAEAGL